MRTDDTLLSRKRKTEVARFPKSRPREPPTISQKLDLASPSSMEALAKHGALLSDLDGKGRQPHVMHIVIA